MLSLTKVCMRNESTYHQISENMGAPIDLFNGPSEEAREGTASEGEVGRGGRDAGGGCSAARPTGERGVTVGGR